MNKSDDIVLLWDTVCTWQTVPYHSISLLTCPEMDFWDYSMSWSGRVSNPKNGIIFSSHSLKFQHWTTEQENNNGIYDNFSTTCLICRNSNFHVLWTAYILKSYVLVCWGQLTTPKMEYSAHVLWNFNREHENNNGMCYFSTTWVAYKKVDFRDLLTADIKKCIYFGALGSTYKLRNAIFSNFPKFKK